MAEYLIQGETLTSIADKIRVALDKVGIVLKDSKEGTIWEVK